MDPEAARAIVEEYLRAGREGDREAWLGLFAEDATLEDPVGTEVHRGMAALEAFYDTTMGSTEGLDNELHELRVAGNTAAFLFTLRIDWRGRRYEVSPIDVLEFDDAGKIVRMRAHWAPSDMEEVTA
ncbi:MAG TPA: nuclear transport factor 2 family protein [Acidimicrobiales bacterium]|nr:nuclear transport factor 2 family protein [Acidimicrobiales bacterium]